MPHVLFKYGTCVLIVYFYNSMSKKKKNVLVNILNRKFWEFMCQIINSGIYAWY